MSEAIEKTEKAIETHLYIKSMKRIFSCLEYFHTFLFFQKAISQWVKQKSIKKTNRHKYNRSNHIYFILETKCLKYIKLNKRKEYNITNVIVNAGNYQIPPL
mgnify:CR=1 FL=1|jgi:hypothetical protein